MTTEPFRLSIPSTEGVPGETHLYALGCVPAGVGPRLLITGDFCPGTDLPIEMAWLAPDPGSEEPLQRLVFNGSDST